MKILVILDKDRNPKWKPNRIEEVTKEMVDEYFRPLENQENEIKFE